MVNFEVIPFFEMFVYRITKEILAELNLFLHFRVGVKGLDIDCSEALFVNNSR